ncbi:ornithine decarboxylase-like [Ciona intestinalis]
MSHSFNRTMNDKIITTAYSYTNDQNIYIINDETDRHSFAATMADNQTLGQTKSWDESFYIGDLNRVFMRHQQWKEVLPRVELFYAVKCCPLMPVIRLLAALGTGFDCASQNEIESVISIGVDPAKIIYALPCKPASQLQHARTRKVALMTFDNQDELHKIQKYFPDARLVIRLLPDETGATFEMGKKFGCTLEEGQKLLVQAKKLDLNVIGVRFHIYSFFVGDDCKSSTGMRINLENCRKMFDFASSIGITMDLLDIGGGFPGGDKDQKLFLQIANDTRDALDKLFPSECGVRIIAEPGRYFVESSFSLATNIVGKKQSQDIISYYTNESIYLSFWKIFLNAGKYTPIVLKTKRFSDKMVHDTIIYGTTCDGTDIIAQNVALPELDLEDWLIWDDMGAYTVLCKSGFNGVMTTKAFHFVQEGAW